jgi:hypothetical protein
MVEDVLRGTIPAAFQGLIASRSLVLVEFSPEHTPLPPQMGHLLRHFLDQQPSVLKVDPRTCLAIAQTYRIAVTPTLVVFARGTEVVRATATEVNRLSALAPTVQMSPGAPPTPCSSYGCSWRALPGFRVCFRHLCLNCGGDRTLCSGRPHPVPLPGVILTWPQWSTQLSTVLPPVPLPMIPGVGPIVIPPRMQCQHFTGIFQCQAQAMPGSFWCSAHLCPSCRRREKGRLDTYCGGNSCPGF